MRNSNGKTPGCTPFRVLAAMLCFGAVAFAQQPTIQSAVNAASFAAASQPNGKLALGGIFAVFGAALGPEQPVQVSSFPVPVELGGTAVEVSSGGNTLPCGIILASATHVNAILPSNMPEGDATLTVKTPAGTATLPLQVVQRNVGIFTLSGTGSGTAMLTNPTDSDPATNANSIVTPAQPGQVWDLWATGLGPISTSDLEQPSPADMADVPVEVLVGGKQAEILFRGRSSCCAGVDHIRFRVPEGTSGCCASLTVRIAGSESNRTSIAIAGSDGACSGDLLPEQLRYFRAQGQWRFGGVGISRQISYRQNDTTGTGTAVAAGNFYLYDARFAYRYACIPAAPSQAVNGWEEKKMGPCTVTRFRFSASFSTPTLPPPSAPAPAPTPGPTSPPMRSLDAGAALSMTGGPGGPVQLPRTTIPGQDSMFAYGAADRFTPPEPAPGSLAERLLAPGRRTLSGPGGADIGSFSEEIEIPPRLVWTNVAEINSIRRGEPLRLTWTGGSPEVPLAVAGTSAQFEITAISFAMDQAYFQCLVDNSPGAFTVPAEVVAELPAGSSPGSLGVVSWRSREMRVPDLDFSAISYSDSTMKTLSIVQP